MLARRVPTALGLLWLLSHPSPVRAQEHVQVVWDQLQAAYGALHDQEYQVQNYIFGHLGSGRTDSWTWTLTGGTRYAVMGACDRDCSDLDIFVDDAGGKVIARDETEDDVPLVLFTPPRDGRYTVRIRMYACSEEPCYFGIGLFRQ